MVDWDRVAELRSKGWDWDRIADDPKVGFHPDASVEEPGRALRSLYHRQRSRQARRGEEEHRVKPLTKEERDRAERKWTMVRICYLLVPVVGLWFLFAYLVPSPVGLVLPAIPYLALGLVVVAFLLLFGLFRSTGVRWNAVFRSTVIWGVILGLMFSGVIALGGAIFGCPFLPPAAAGASQPGAGWAAYSVSPWHENGLPVLYFYGATWCPYCSASSWAIWKALTEFGTVSGAVTSYSSSSDVYASTPEMVLAGVSLSSTTIAFQVTEDTSGVDGTFPTTVNCFQQAYYTAYSGSSIPFVAVNGQYVHGGSTLIDPANLGTWSAGSNGGATAVQTSVASESGAPWGYISDQAWWIMAYLTKSTGLSVTQLAGEYKWSSATQAAVTSDLSLLS